ncbi:MAG TPA: adenylate cyclase regulatory domain-containing protein, partial [Actinomycetota bacterium]|nr:adenylate cyclase regulatory domain-containing protein [Actinomycetota bacterium]
MTDLPGTDETSFEELLGLGTPLYTSAEISKRAGIPQDEAQRIWRAMGFVEPAEDTKHFTEADLELLVRVVDFMKEGFADLELILGMTRVISRSVGLLADAEADAIHSTVVQNPSLLEEIDEKGLDSIAPRVFDDLEAFLVHVWRRHLGDALARRNLEELPGREEPMAVGFADLVGFTRLSRYIDGTELAALVEKF